MNNRLLILPGDGIGPEIMAATVAVLQATDRALNLGLHLEESMIGLAALAAKGTTFPAAVADQARAADGIILGPVSHNSYPPQSEGGHNPSAQLRKQLDLYANLRPARSRRGIALPCGKPLDLVIVRENTEGFYADRTMHSGPGEFMPTPDTALALRKITRAGSRRIAERGFELAATRPAQHVTTVHKANVLRMTDGLFLDEVRAVAARYPQIRHDEMLVDAMAAHLVRDPARFDVIITTNMFGDILSDLTAELSGSLGLAASLNLGTDHAMAQAQHGSAPDIAGADQANPASLIGSAAMLLEWLGGRRGQAGLQLAGRTITRALDETLADPATRTPDLGGPLGTRTFTAVLLERLSDAFDRIARNDDG